MQNAIELKLPVWTISPYRYLYRPGGSSRCTWFGGRQGTPSCAIDGTHTPNFTISGYYPNELWSGYKVLFSVPRYCCCCCCGHRLMILAERYRPDTLDWCLSPQQQHSTSGSSNCVSLQVSSIGRHIRGTATLLDGFGGLFSRVSLCLKTQNTFDYIKINFKLRCCHICEKWLENLNLITF